MFSGFLSSLAKVTKGVISSYAETLEPYSLEVVTLACARFKDCDVPDQSREFAPSVAALADQCRLFRDAIAFRDRNKAEREKIIVYPIGELPPPPAVPLGPISVDFGHGRIDMRDKTPAEREAIMQAKGLPPDAVPQIKRME
jgi:hypothetical protein